MTKSIIIFIFLVIIHSAASSVCSYTYARVLSWKYCTYGCCSQYSYDPCCDAPLRPVKISLSSEPATTGSSLTPAACGSTGFLVFMMGAILCYRRRRTLITRHNEAPMVASQVATISTAVNNDGAYSNPQFQGPPPYATEAPRY